jgi:hypothetical protein
MVDCGSGNISLNKTFIIGAKPVIPVLPCSAYTTDLIFSCNGNKVFTFSGDTITPYMDIIPNEDGVLTLGTNIRRFRDVNTISGTSSVWTSTEVVNTPNLNLGVDSDGNQRNITADSSVIQNDILNGGIF